MNDFGRGTDVNSMVEALVWANNDARLFLPEGAKFEVRAAIPYIEWATGVVHKPIAWYYNDEIQSMDLEEVAKPRYVTTKGYYYLGRYMV